MSGRTSPGPWSAKVAFVQGSEGHFEVRVSPTEDALKQAQRDARLIAHAPTMLETLKAIDKLVIIGPLTSEQGRQLMKICDLARATIALAEGEE